MRTLMTCKIKRRNHYEATGPGLSAVSVVARGWGEVPLAAGSSDDINVFVEGHGPDRQLVVLTSNERLGYAGLEIFNLGDKVPSGEIFCQGHEQVAEIVGPREFNLEPINLAKRMYVYAS